MLEYTTCRECKTCMKKISNECNGYSMPCAKYELQRDSIIKNDHVPRLIEYLIAASQHYRRKADKSIFFKSRYIEMYAMCSRIAAELILMQRKG